MADAQKPDVETPKKKQKRLSKSEWAEIAALWELGEAEMDELVRRTGLHKDTIYRKFKKMGAEKNSRAKEHEQKIRDAVEEKALDDASVWAERRVRTKEDHYKWIETLEKMGMQEVISAVKEGVPIAVRMDNLKAIEKALSIVSKGRDERYILTGLVNGEDDLEDLPDLVIREMTVDQIEKSVQENLGQGDELDMPDISVEELDG